MSDSTSDASCFIVRCPRCAAALQTTADPDPTALHASIDMGRGALIIACTEGHLLAVVTPASLQRLIDHGVRCECGDPNCPGSPANMQHRRREGAKPADPKDVN